MKRSISTAKEFGSLIRRHRKALGMTQRELALAVNTGERFIVDLEKGKESCQLGKALHVAKAVGIRLNDGKGMGRQRIAGGYSLEGLT